MHTYIHLPSLISRYHQRGGRADTTYPLLREGIVVTPLRVQWRQDVYNCAEGGEALLGEVLYACMQKAVLYESDDCKVR